MLGFILGAIIVTAICPPSWCALQRSIDTCFFNKQILQVSAYIPNKFYTIYYFDTPDNLVLRLAKAFHLDLSKPWLPYILDCMPFGESQDA
ncbi:hypothetical protein HI914_06824 [Erysiphe necator]|nr:hypothetical protein HI914_06824 [Erysiphe necator]